MASGIVANTNIPSLNAARVLSKNRNDLETAMERLASGKRINSAQDDAAGLAVASKMRADVKSFNVAVRNISDGVSLVQTYDGAAAEVESLLTRMRELAVQMSNNTYDDTANADYAYAEAEYLELGKQIVDISENTEFNRTVLADGTFTGVIKSGALSGDGDEISIALDDLDVVTGALADAAGDFADSTDASAEIAALDTALASIATARATAGGYLSRLSFALSNAQNQSQRLSQSLSAIEDTDYATESAALARGMVLAQAGSAMLAQANQAPQYILTLLRG
jgi:flagellin